MSPRAGVLAATVAAHLALIIGLIATSKTVLSLLAALLLFAPLPGLLRGDGYTVRWATLLLVFYVAFLLGEGTARPDSRTASFALAAVAAADFIGLIACSRLTNRAIRARMAG